MELNLAGKTAVVTGGARGIGLTVARALASEGVNVALLDLLDGVGAAADQIAADFGVRALGRRLDVTDQDATNAAFEAVREELGTPQVLLRLRTRNRGPHVRCPERLADLFRLRREAHRRRTPSATTRREQSVATCRTDFIHRRITPEPAENPSNMGAAGCGLRGQRG